LKIVDSVIRLTLSAISPNWCPSLFGVIPLHDENPTVHRAFVTVAIILACVGIYFLVQPTPFASTQADRLFDARHAAIPTEVIHGKPITVCQAVAASVTAEPQTCTGSASGAPVAPGKHTRLAVLSSIFLHASIIHLAGNMLYLWIFGNNVEDRMRPVGYLLFFLAGGAVATLAHILASPSSTSPLIGASGAVAAVMGAYFVWYPRARVSTLIFIMVLRIRAFWLLLIWFVLQFFTGASSHVAWVAHVGGFLFGIIVALAMGRRPRHSPAVHLATN
jgi:membrane associated rhomboid family serine protease